MASSQHALHAEGAGRVRKRAHEIVDAAARVFAEKGFHGTSTHHIAEELGLRQASLYYYFTSKEAALEQVCAHGVDGFVEAAEAISQSEGSPAEKIERLIQAHLTPMETRRDYVRVFLNERRYLPSASRKRIGRAGRRLERIFQSVIESGIADGTFRPDIDARTATLALLGMCNAVINWNPAEPGAGAEHLTREFAGIVLSGMGLRAGKPRPARRRPQIKGSGRRG